jgi:hypothetical protein
LVAINQQSNSMAHRDVGDGAVVDGRAVAEAGDEAGQQRVEEENVDEAKRQAQTQDGQRKLPPCLGCLHEDRVSGGGGGGGGGGAHPPRFLFRVWWWLLLFVVRCLMCFTLLKRKQSETPSMAGCGLG